MFTHDEMGTVAHSGKVTTRPADNKGREVRCPGPHGLSLGTPGAASMSQIRLAVIGAGSQCTASLMPGIPSTPENDLVAIFDIIS